MFLILNVFYEIECGREPFSKQKIELDALRLDCEKIIKQADSHKIFDSYVNKGIIQTLVEKEKNNPSKLNNWILIFDWNTGNFVSWDVVAQNPEEAVAAYSKMKLLTLQIKALK